MIFALFEQKYLRWALNDSQHINNYNFLSQKDDSFQWNVYTVQLVVTGHVENIRI